MGENSGMPILWRSFCLKLSGKRGKPNSGARSTSGRLPNLILHMRYIPYLSTGNPELARGYQEDVGFAGFRGRREFPGL